MPMLRVAAAVLRMAERHASHSTWLMTSEDRGEALSTCICPGPITQTAASAQATTIATRGEHCAGDGARTSIHQDDGGGDCAGRGGDRRHYANHPGAVVHAAHIMSETNLLSASAARRKQLLLRAQGTEIS